MRESVEHVCSATSRRRCTRQSRNAACVLAMLAFDNSSCPPPACVTLRSLATRGAGGVGVGVGVEVGVRGNLEVASDPGVVEALRAVETLAYVGL